MSFRRKVVVSGVMLVVLVGLLLAALRGPIALRIVRAGVERTLTADFIGELPDGLHVVLCGAGGPFPDGDRSGPCVAVIAGESLFVVDAGSEAARNLPRMGLPPGRVEELFLTHFHSDHIDGLGELALQRWVGGTHEEPLGVNGPTGVEEVVTGFNLAYRQDARYRTAHHGDPVAPSSGAGLLAHPFARPPPGGVIALRDEEGLRIVAFRVEHDPADPAVGYRFDYGRRSVLISGDTSKSQNVIAQARGVDLLVHEALSDRMIGAAREAALAAGRTNIAKILFDVPGYHATPVEAAEVAQAAQVGHLLYYHVVPPLPLPGLAAVYLDGVEDAYDGGVTLGRDGTMISLPRDSDAIEISQR